VGYREVELVLDNGPTPDPLALLMVALASHASANGWCWPGHETLARRTRKTPRQVIRNLKALACAGWLTIHPRSAGEGKRQTAYTLNMTRLGNTRGDAQMSHDIQMSPQFAEPVDFHTSSAIRDDIQVSPQSRGDISGGCDVTFETLRSDILPLPILRNQRTKEPIAADASERVIVYDETAQNACPPKPQLVRKGSARKNASATYDPKFEAAYASYPKHEEKPGSEKEYFAAVARLMKGEKGFLPMSKIGADQVIQDAAAHYAIHMTELDREQQHIRSMRRWLREQTYLDFLDRRNGSVPAKQQGAIAAASRSITEKIAEQRSGTR